MFLFLTFYFFILLFSSKQWGLKGLFMMLKKYKSFKYSNLNCKIIQIIIIDAYSYTESILSYTILQLKPFFLVLKIFRYSAEQDRNID